MTLEELAKWADSNADKWSETEAGTHPQFRKLFKGIRDPFVAAAAAIRELQNKRDNCSGICSKILESETNRLLGEIKP